MRLSLRRGTMRNAIFRAFFVTTLTGGLACGGGDDEDMTGPMPGGDDAADGADDGGADDGDAAAGDGGEVDNVAACEDLVEELTCGDVDLGASLQCDSFAGYPCDLVDYFDCLADNFSCTDGVPDGDIASCASLATCS